VSPNRCYFYKAIRVKYSNSVFVDFLFDHAKRMRRLYFNLCFVCLCRVFFIISNRAGFWKTEERNVQFIL